MNSVGPGALSRRKTRRHQYGVHCGVLGAGPEAISPLGTLPSSDSPLSGGGGAAGLHNVSCTNPADSNAAEIQAYLFLLCFWMSTRALAEII